MDEPSRGIDVGAKVRRVPHNAPSRGAQGLGILFVTSDLEEVMALSDRIAVMSNGRLTALFDRADATEALDRGRFGGRAMRPATASPFFFQPRWQHDLRPKPLAAFAGGSSGGSVLLTVMKLRTFIALFAVLIVVHDPRARTSCRPPISF